MRRPLIRWLITCSVIYCVFGFRYSLHLPETEKEVVFAQTDAGKPANAGSPVTGKSKTSQHGDTSARVFGVLALLVSCAAIGRVGAGKLKQSPVLGELAIGIIVGAILYQAGNPALIIIRHSQLVQRVAENTLSTGKNWETTVQSTVRSADLPEEAAARVERVMMSRDFPAYLSLARSIQLFAGFGVAMLLFMVGLEVSLKELRAIGSSASLVATTGVVATFTLTCLATLLLQPKTSGLMPALFAGSALCATSIGISARIFKDMKRLRIREARIVLGAAVLDDVLGLIMLSVVTTLATYGSIEVRHLFWILLKTVLFLGAVVIFGTRFLDKTVQALSKLDLGNIKLLYPFVLLMFLAWLADKIGLAAIVGAFAAGVIIKEESFSGVGPGLDPEQSIESIHASLEGILAPIFFVLIGLQMDIATLGNLKVLLVGLVLTAVAVAGKLACSLGVTSGADRLIVSIGMLPRVEVALIVASIGKSLGVLDAGLYSVIIIAVLLTILMTPPLLKWSMERKQT